MLLPDNHAPGTGQGDTKKARYMRRYQSLKLEFESWRSHGMDISRVLLPRSTRFFGSEANRGDRKHGDIYDNTASRALRVLGAGMMAGATSPARPWFRLGSSDPDLGKRPAVRVYLDDLRNLVLRVFAKSNTYRALHTMYEELGAFGTAVSVVLPDFDTVIHHYPVPFGEFMLAQDHRGKVNTLYRCFPKTVAEVVHEFGLAACSLRVQQQFRDGNLDNRVEVVHAIEPRWHRDIRKLDATNMAWASCYFEIGGEDGQFLRESGFETFPVLAPRWSVTAGDVYGGSPGMEALGDIRQLQHEQLRKANGIDYMSNPPVQAHTSLKGQEIRRMPGGVTYVDMAMPHGGIRNAFDVKLDLNHLLLDIQDVRERINSTFFADLFLMLAMAGTNTKMTATEVAERHEEKLLMLGPVLERLHTELLEPLIEMTIRQLAAVGMLPPAPPELQGQELDVEFISMLAQAQRAIGANSIDRLVGGIAAIGQFQPEVIDKLNVDAWADETADILGVTPRILRTDDEVAALREARNRAMAAKEQSAALAEQAKTARDFAAAKTAEPSALTELIGNYSGYQSPTPQEV